MNELSNSIERKFREVYDVNDWLIDTDTGWEEIVDIKQTTEYKIWKLELENELFLECADDHIVFLEDYTEVFIKDLNIGDLVLTKFGSSKVVSITETEESDYMYDIGVNSVNHRYYTNDILSHNTTCAAAYLLWYAMFHSDKTVLIAAHKFVGAQEIMLRIRYGYELCADHIRSGVVNYNKGSMDFDNGSRIVSSTTTETTGRGMSISILYCLEGDTSFVKIRNKSTLEEEEISLSNLYSRLIAPEKLIT